MKEVIYSNVFAGQDAIEVPPWVLPCVKLLAADKVPGAVGPVLEFSASKNESGDHTLIHAIPSGFITAQFMELDLSSDEEIAGFCGQWGLVASPYAGSIERAHERLLDPDAEARLLLAEYDASKEAMPSDIRAVDFERFGRDIWYSGLNNSKLDFAYTAHLDGSCWLNAFKRDSSSKGSEVLNARRFADGGEAGSTYAYVEEVRQTLAIMRIAVIYHGFVELAKGDAAYALGKARRYDDGAEKETGHRPFEEALSLFMSFTDFLHMPAKTDTERAVREEVFRQQAEIINDNTMLFAELCLHTTPAPLVPHSGFRRGSLRTAKMPSGMNRWATALCSMPCPPSSTPISTTGTLGIVARFAEDRSSTSSSACLPLWMKVRRGGHTLAATARRRQSSARSATRRRCTTREARNTRAVLPGSPAERVRNAHRARCECGPVAILAAGPFTRTCLCFAERLGYAAHVVRIGVVATCGVGVVPEERRPHLYRYPFVSGDGVQRRAPDVGANGLQALDPASISHLRIKGANGFGAVRLIPFALWVIRCGGGEDAACAAEIRLPLHEHLAYALIQHGHHASPVRLACLVRDLNNGEIIAHLVPRERSRLADSKSGRRLQCRQLNDGAASVRELSA